MVTLTALRKIIRRTEAGDLETISKNQVFTATPLEAKQLDALTSARPSWEKEIARFKADQDRANGVSTVPAVKRDNATDKAALDSIPAVESTSKSK
jgi:hypothetical protein